VPGYDLQAELGRGGMGVVYRAFDRRRRETVALKMMQRADPSWLARFKREFRTLTGISHSNLVGLYDLISDGDQWFFTMELVEGSNFLTYVRSAEPGAPEIPIDLADTYVPSPTDENDPGDRTAPLAGSFHSDRLRRALKQLADGVIALHRAGKLHRDIKPANVLVTSSERVVLLDFGLAVDTGPAGLYQSTEQHVLGTAAYMAPEQAAGAPVSPASDWYSVGVMLYEALTGRLPFTGPFLQVIVDKQTEEPPPPAELVPGVPDDLNSLCIDLLHRDPQARPSGEEVYRRIVPVDAGPAERFSHPLASVKQVPFLGREHHLAALANAYREMKDGKTVIVRLHGASGMGKTTLLDRFLNEIRERREAVVLAGRCCEQESVPYKALDSLVDALTTCLLHFSGSELRGLFPRGMPALARVFPVLRRLELRAEFPMRRAEVHDEHELRRQAFAALRELLIRLGDRNPLVLAIDDLQWGDLDSARLLAELVRPPDPPVLLLLVSYREEDADTSSCLCQFFAAQEATGPVLERVDLRLAPLSHAEARALAQNLLELGGLHAPDQADIIARESAGNPFLLAELADHLREAGSGSVLPSSAGTVSLLEEVLWSRITKLSEASQRLLNVVAVAGRPIHLVEACQAAETGEDGRAAVAALRFGRLVRGTAITDENEIETYHDRIRETVVTRLAPETLTEYHRRLAAVLEASGKADPEVLAYHLHGAGEASRAGSYFAQAAGQAAQALAFDRAVKLYRRALELGPGNGAEERRLRTQLGHALVNAGRGAEAGREYLVAAAAASGTEALELHKCAMAQFFFAGLVDDGFAALATVLKAVGLKIPSTSRRVLLAVLFHRAQLRLRGIRFQERPVSAISPLELSRIDICWLAGRGLAMIDPIRGAYFQSIGLLLALRAGELERLVRLLAYESMLVAIEGGKRLRRANQFLEVADTLAQRIGKPEGLGYAAVSRGMAEYCAERWKSSLEACDRAERIFREECIGASRILNSTYIVAMLSLIHRGALVELSRRCPALLQEAQGRGDLYAVAFINTYSMTWVRLARDDPDEARKEVKQTIAQWSTHGYHLQHLYALLARVEIELYCGDGLAALNHLSSEWRQYARSLVGRVQDIRIRMFRARAFGALMTARSSANASSYLRIAERDARRLRRERMPWAVALAQYVGAAIAFARGNAAISGELLADAAERFDALDMPLCAAATRRRLGQLLEGEEGKTLIAQADSWMSSQQIRNPTRMTALLAPGFPD
jgi:serine/threonine protein kinase